MFSASRQTNQSPFTPCFYLITSPRAKGLLQRPFWPSDTWQHYIIRISCSTGIQGTQFCQPQYLKESTRWKYPCLPLDQRFKKMRGGREGKITPHTTNTPPPFGEKHFFPQPLQINSRMHDEVFLMPGMSAWKRACHMSTAAAVTLVPGREDPSTAPISMNQPIP